MDSEACAANGNVRVSVKQPEEMVHQLINITKQLVNVFAQVLKATYI